MSKQLERKKATQFQKGQSGNPAGRPKGSKNKSTLLKEAMQDKTDRLLSRHVPNIMKVVIQQALKGCTQSQKMILDRAVPAKKAEDGSAGSNAGGITIRIENLTTPEAKVIEGEIVEDGETQEG